MALKGVSLWGCAKSPNLHVGAFDLEPRPCGFALTLSGKLDFFSRKIRKLECCSLGVLAHRAVTPVEDERPDIAGMEPSATTNLTQEDNPQGFHKDLSLLPS